MAINIVQCNSTVNTTAKSGRTIKYLVIHYTAGLTSKAGAAKNVAAYFMSGNAGGSADFIVDDATMVQYNPDPTSRYCWAVGGNKYTDMSTSEGGTHYGSCTNSNCISIEICSNKTDQSSQSASDTDWYFTEAAVANAVELAKYLMKLYSIDADHVIMHHNITGKICPNPWCVTESRLTQWENFKAQLTGTEADTEMVTTGTITINGKSIKIDKIVKDDTTYIKLRGLEAAGFAVGYDADTKNLTLDNETENIDVTVDGQATTLEAVNLNGSNFCKLRELATKTGIMEIDYQDRTVIINTK